MQEHHVTVDDEREFGNVKGSMMAQYNTQDTVKFRVGNEEALGVILDSVTPSASFDTEGPTWYLIKRIDQEYASPTMFVHEGNVLQKIEEA